MSQSAARPVTESVDSELQKVIDIAAHIGYTSGDDVNVSYTSLMLAMLWSDDQTSRWLQSKITELGASLDGIYHSRSGISEANREAILSKVRSGDQAPKHPDFMSVSARTVMQEAASVAAETGKSPSEPLGVRHLAAVYIFRNPPGHDPQLLDDWQFDLEKWRPAFADFIREKFPQELQKWTQVGYLATEGINLSLPGNILGSYSFDTEAVGILRSVEDLVSRKSPPVFTSVALLDTLVQVRTYRDSDQFRKVVAGAFKVTGETHLLQPETPFTVSGSPHPISHGFKNILDRSRLLARSITGTEAIGVRHILASILVRPDSTAYKMLVDKGVDIPSLRRTLYIEFTHNWLGDNGVQWNFSLVGRAPTSIASYTSDRADKGEDALDVTRYASAFAAVLAAESVSPPLSIGVFGDWGSGKSFFMRLMQDETQKVCALPDVDGTGKRLFCRNVVSIPFNAWHYSEENLFASLVQTILLGLRKALVGDSADSDFMDKVLARLEVAKLARKEAEQKVNEAKSHLDSCQTDLQTARQDAATKLSELKTLKTKDAVKIVGDRIFPDRSKNSDKVIALAQTYLGISNVGEFADEQKRTYAEATRILEQVGLTSRRVQSTGQWLLRAPVNWDESWKPALAAIAIVPVAGVVIALTKNYIGTAWPVICAAGEQLGVAVHFIHGFAQRHLATINGGLDAVDQMRGQIDSTLAAERRQIEEQVQAAEKNHKDAQAKVESSESALKTAEANVQQAERDLAECKSERRIARLVQQRLEAKDYEKHLGIIATIRNDFETLTKLMKEMRTETPPPGSTIQPIDRIVLYIDDLDRCPTSKVVSVLEAIHLFLAFELFVVVVGVDVRWAARSLEEKYPRHLSQKNGGSALDYLEKIFQIPFWLPPMEPLASQNLIADLIPVVEIPVVELAPAAPNKPASAGPASAASVPNAPVGGGSSQAPAARAAEAKKTEMLHLQAEERLFMLSLAGAVGKSPRRLKRFVNTYQIFKGSIDALARETFVLEQGKTGDYRSAMTLLAMVTGAPRTAMEIFENLCDPNNSESFETLSEKQRKDIQDGPYITAAYDVFKAAGIKDSELKNWAPHVARFSFRAGRI